MQHSPTDVKKRLDQAVDPDGNVMDLVAVLEIVSILEKLPLTKEALERTRIGRTINLLRKKTENAELAKRAKKLVKKWQTLVASHLEALRIADSPLNGQQSSSLQINGVIAKDGERSHSAGSEKLDKCKLLEGKRKRKRESSSSESSPIVFSKNLDEIKKSSTLPNPGSKKLAISKLLSKGNASSLEQICDKDNLLNDGGTVSNNSHNKTLSTNCSSDIRELTNENKSDNLSLPLISRSHSSDKLVLDREKNSEADGGANKDISKEFVETVPNLDISEVKEDDGIKCVETSDRLLNEVDGMNELSLLNNLQSDKVLDICNASSKSVVENDLFLSQDNFNCSQEDSCSQVELTEPKAPIVITERMLDMSIEATGINGRYGCDGKWYGWTDVMPLSDGNLSILPYVILD